MKSMMIYTFRYYALQTVENSPYAKPPASAALSPITTTQAERLKSIGLRREEVRPLRADLHQCDQLISQADDVYA